MPTDPLAGALQECSLHVLLILISKGLTRAGYGDVEILGRRHLRQKSRFGGHEISCVSNVGKSPVKVLVKVIDQDVRTRNFDEMAGTLGRNLGDVGIIITTKKVSPKMAARQAGYLPIRIETMDGDALARLIRCSGVGLGPSGEVDYAYLAQLEELSERMFDFVKKEGL